MTIRISNEEPPEPQPRPPRGLRWWPALLVLILVAGAIVWIRAKTSWSFQERNLRTLTALIGAAAILLIWWLTASAARWKLRVWVVAVLAVAVGLGATLFRIRGVSGDLVPIVELRWKRPASLAPSLQLREAASRVTTTPRSDFPQFLGPNRTGILEAPALKPDWGANPPKILWCQSIGAGWSGWAIVGTRALTQEQRSEGESSTCYDALTGQLLWAHAEAAHYQTTLAGEGPRCTPTVESNRVFTLGATGILNCLDLETGRQLWSHNIVEDAQSHVPDWGFAGSPLLFDEKVIVSAGGPSGRSLLAYHVATGELAWAGGSQPASYSSPVLVSLDGVRQVLAFDHRRISAHDPDSGQMLWEYPWGNGQPQVAVPVVVGTNRVVFSSGYGVGSELLEINQGPEARLGATRVWKSTKLKAKFANLLQRDGYLYGLDDGILSCLDLRDGSQRWKEGRYGHGQALLIRDLLVLMAENGELVLLRPTPESPHELGRFRVFGGKTWNPIAVSGDLLFTRNDKEAACLRLAVEPSAR